MNKPAIFLLIVLIALYLLLEEKSYPVKPLPKLTPLPPLRNKEEKKTMTTLEWETDKWKKEIHYGFTPQLVRSWKLDGHNHFTAAKWIKEGVLPTEHGLVSWIANQKSKSISAYKLPNYSFNEPEWVISKYGSIEPLRKEYYQRYD